MDVHEKEREHMGVDIERALVAIEETANRNGVMNTLLTTNNLTDFCKQGLKRHPRSGTDGIRRLSTSFQLVSEITRRNWEKGGKAIHKAVIAFET